MRKFKKLNRKGFTLIELLAVIVILAVIMVIASTSVLGSMNSSKRKSLQNSAASAADAFTTAFSETILENKDVILGISDLMEGKEDKTAVEALTNVDQKAIGINSNDYNLEKSYAIYDGTRVTICFSVGSTSQFYVAADKSTKDVTIGTGTTQTLDKDTMWACSDGTNSWTTGQTSQTS